MSYSKLNKRISLEGGFSTEILWEDESFLIANKPSGLPVHETKDPKRPDFTRLVAKALHISHLRTVNRLDLGTSGIVLLGKEGADNSYLDGILSSGKKEYLFIAEGLPDWIQKRSECFLKDGNKRVSVVRSGGKKAITEFEVLIRDDAKLLFLGKANLITGRRHQIRIMISEEGFPILGDDVYGKEKADSEKRMYLHAWKFSFQGKDGKEVVIQSSLPKSFSERMQGIESVLKTE
ncbi:RluA family pseudouridine synthase [Leptospira idonii]|uniref:RluA family pseudouridine synthase n=1 Tax=Leptospira idonii TaxID=1193500 RepID=A0A4R9LWY6_9LEPT|nr:RluA family pseudouridine synthase [Leptospira idonii]TGN18162.1 RluA family pseudouridine synthase [Leptospira idonii]